MITDENKQFLKEKFNIDCDNYSNEELNKKIDSIIKIIDDNIEQTKQSIKVKLEELKELNEESY